MQIKRQPLENNRLRDEKLASSMHKNRSDIIGLAAKDGRISSADSLGIKKSMNCSDRLRCVQ